MIFSNNFNFMQIVSQLKEKTEQKVVKPQFRRFNLNIGGCIPITVVSTN